MRDMGRPTPDHRPPLLERTSARLGLFAVVLLAAFGAGFGVGAALDGEGSDGGDPAPQAPTHDSHEEGGR